MAKPTLYLMLGYPGSGKTTTSKYIHELTGSVHLWADHIRRERYGTPTYNHGENLDLYAHMNQMTAELLAAKNDVIFDTNFNFYKDRQHLRQIARDHNANVRLIWVTTPEHIARQRATDGAHKTHTRILGDMDHDTFERLSSELEPPHDDEPYITLDGSTVTKETVKALLNQATNL